jgi:mannose-6-phosphate isomerase-like protein (cupin superfamily)
MKTLVAGSLVMMAAGVFGLDRGTFVSEKGNIQRLAVERIRSAPMDFEKVMVGAEKRLRGLHAELHSGGKVDSAALEEDLRQLRGACQKMQRNAAVRKTPPEDPAARALIEKIWARYQTEVKILRENVKEKANTQVPHPPLRGTFPQEGKENKGFPSPLGRGQGEGPDQLPEKTKLSQEKRSSRNIEGDERPPQESRVYWETTGAFKEVRMRTTMDLLYNVPARERSLDEAFLRDESALLKACEITPKKTRGVSVRVVVPQEHSLKADPDVQTFYRSLDLVPDAQPIRSGGFLVPVGARTVTLRENKAKMVFRPRRGKGVAYLGQSETEIQYGYVAVPPDTAYYFENIGSEPLELEFVGLKP